MYEDYAKANYHRVVLGHSPPPPPPPHENVYAYLYGYTMGVIRPITPTLNYLLQLLTS